MNRKKQFVRSLLGVGYLLSPLFVFAITIQGILKDKILPIINAVIPILFGLAFLYFLWGMVQYIQAPDEGLKEEGRNKIIYGIIGLFVMVAVWGLVEVVRDTFLGSTPLGAPSGVPKFPGQSSIPGDNTGQ